MSSVPAVIVKKGGFLSALFHGLFGLLTVVVVCASVLVFYGMYMVDQSVGGLVTISRQWAAGLPQWRQNLPPLLADALNDRRAPEYRDRLEVSAVRCPSPDDPRRLVTVVTVANKGTETVSLLALNVLLEKNGVPVDEEHVYAATPVALDVRDWRGPLYPGGRPRRFAVGGCWHPAEPLRELDVAVEIAEVRVWNGPLSPDAPQSIADMESPLSAPSPPSD